MKGVNGSISYQDVKMHKSEDVTYHCNGKEFTHLVSARVYKMKKNIMYGYVKYTIEERTVSHVEIRSSQYVS